MAWKKPPDTGSIPPTLHTPKGASPRGWHADAFSSGARPQAHPQSALEPPPETPAAPDEPRDWDFALPPPPSRPEHETLIEPDTNHRHHAGLHPPAETATLPATSQECFAGNWERLVSEPLPPRRSRKERSLQGSKLTGWLFSNGRLEVNALVGLVILLALLSAAFVYGRRLLTSHDTSPSPPADATPR